MAGEGTASATGWLDRAAIGLSGLCLIHCAATALLVALAASTASIFTNPAIHEVGLVLALGFGVIALVRGAMSHGRKLPLLIGCLGLGAMAYALSLRHGVPGEVVFTIIGVCLVATGHGLNRRAHAVIH
jgi:EamA domain-containing membrane protein RarD